MLRCQFLCHVLKAFFLFKYSFLLILSYFCKKIAKFSSAVGSAPIPPYLRCKGLCPQPPAQGASPPDPKIAPPPQLRISGYAPVQEDSFDSSELLPLSRLKSCYRFLYLHNPFKRTNNKIFYQRGAKHMPVYHKDL